MPQQTKFYLEKLKDGSWTNQAPYNKLLQTLQSIKPGRWLVTLEKYYPQRTLDQNAFYWANFIPAQIECFKEYWGETYSKEQIHDFNKTNVWGEEQVLVKTGEVIRIPESSTKQTTVSWETKLENCRQWFRQTFNYELPYPEKQEQLPI